MSRTARIERATSESSVVVEVNLDGTGQTDISTTVPFYDHMLTALGRHSLIDLTVRATGDTEIDVHHTVEDTAICIGEALRVALGDKRGIRRFGEASVPLDEALAHAVVDISGRPYLVHEGESEAFVHHLIAGSGQRLDSTAPGGYLPGGHHLDLGPDHGQEGQLQRAPLLGGLPGGDPGGEHLGFQ